MKKIQKRFSIFTCIVVFASVTVFVQSCHKSEVAPIVPVLTTVSATAITNNSAVSGGSVTKDGGAAITARGVCWSIVTGPTVANDKTSDGTGTGDFVSSISSLSPGTQYFVRAYATNAVGTAYGNEISFTTVSTSASLMTTAISGITQTAAQSGGTITSDGGATITSRGVCWNTSSGPTVSNSKTTDGTGTGSFSSSLTNLTANTMYYVRAYATNSIGTSYGNEISFISSPATATLSTTAISGITSSTAQSGGSISSDGGAAISARGVCWSTSTGPTISNSTTSDGTGTGIFISSLASLAPGTTYYVRAYATNSAGTAYGNELTFTTQSVVVTLAPIKDTSIFANSSGGGTNSAYGNGASELLMIGFSSSGSVYARTLLQFDLSSIPSTATIDSVSLNLLYGPSGNAATTVYVHPLTESWSEGTANIGCAYTVSSCSVLGVALTSANADATWIYSTYNSSTSWSTLGGGTFPPASASASSSAVANPVSLTTTISFSSHQLVNDVKGWVVQGSTNFGWILKVDEPNVSGTGLMKRFVSKDANGASTTQKPRLIVVYH